jgi:hypothetical protein
MHRIGAEMRQRGRVESPSREASAVKTDAIDIHHAQPLAPDTPAKRRLRSVVALMLVIAGLALTTVFVRSIGADSAVVERSAARMAEWERTRSHEDRAADTAWQRASNRHARHRRLVAAVFLFGNLLIVVACVRSTRRLARDLPNGQLHLDEAFAGVLFRATLALGVAFGVMAATPGIELVTVGGGMYAGEQVVAAMVTAASFFVVWAVALCLAFLALWRCGRVRQLEDDVEPDDIEPDRDGSMLRSFARPQRP